MPDPDPEYTDLMRDTFVEEIEEWFNEGYQDHGPPPYFWFIFDDAGIGVGSIHVLLEEPLAQMSQYELMALAESTQREATEQVLNANYEQIACYTKAREAWVESP